MDLPSFSLEQKYDIPELVSRITTESLSKIIIQTPNSLLPETFKIKKLLQTQIPSLSINILCDKHVFIDFLIFISFF